VRERRAPERIGRLLGSEESGLGPLARQAERLRRATEVLRGALGEPLGEHCVVAALSPEVVIQADAAVWASRLRFLAAPVRTALEPVLERPREVAVRVIVRPPEALEPPARAAARPMFSAEAARSVRRAADSVSEPRLREALRRLAARSER
jgi:hypothetical protein